MALNYISITHITSQEETMRKLCQGCVYLSMENSLRNLFVRFNYTEEKGFICNLPTGENGIHLSIGFDNNRREFNVHFTDDNIKEVGKERRDFILKMPAFRFFLFIKRFDRFYQLHLIRLFNSSRINLGKLKKFRFLFFKLDDSIMKNEILQISSNKKKYRFRKNINVEHITEGFYPISQIQQFDNIFVPVFKWKGPNFTTQGIVFKIDNVLYYLPNKRLNYFQKYVTISLINYINKYPSEETMEFGKIMYEKLSAK